MRGNVWRALVCAGSVLASLGFDVTEEYVDELVRVFDVNGVGTMAFSEFVDMVQEAAEDIDLPSSAPVSPLASASAASEPAAAAASAAAAAPSGSAVSGSSAPAVAPVSVTTTAGKPTVRILSKKMRQTGSRESLSALVAAVRDHPRPCLSAMGTVGML